MAIAHAVGLRNTIANDVRTAIDVGVAAGKIEIRDGTRPANPETAATGTVLATVVLADPAGGAAASGSVTITDPAAVKGVAAGTATWARILDGAGAAVMDCTVTATGGGGDITLSTTTISIDVTVDMGALTYTAPV
jgi:hypothetical protein